MIRTRVAQWKPWNWSTRTWLLAIVASTLASPFVVRWFCLWQVPDVALPFDRESFLTEVTPDDHNPDTYYIAIIEKLEKRQTEWSAYAYSHGYDDRDEWDPRLDQWLLDNADLLSEFEQATQLAPPQAFSKKLLVDPFNVRRNSQMLRNLLRLSQSEAKRYQRAGQLNDAWRWRRAGLRLARHAEAPGTLSDWLLANAIYSIVYDLTPGWASLPSLTPQQLQTARDDLRQSNSMHPKLSDLMRMSYLETEETIRRHGVADLLYPDWDLPPAFEPFTSSTRSTVLWMYAQPEISLRLNRQLLVNNLEQLDRSIPQRATEHRTQYPLVFEDQGMKRVAGQLTAEQLNRSLDSSLGKRLSRHYWFFLAGDRDIQGERCGGLEEIYLRSAVQDAMIDIVLAAHQYQRIHGTFPPDLAALVPEYLPSVPIDPMSRTAAPIQYRIKDQNTAMVLTADDDGPDLTGNVNDSRRGYRVFLKERLPEWDAVK